MWPWTSESPPPGIVSSEAGLEEGPPPMHECGGCCLPSTHFQVQPGSRPGWLHPSPGSMSLLFLLHLSFSHRKQAWQRTEIKPQGGGLGTPGGVSLREGCPEKGKFLYLQTFDHLDLASEASMKRWSAK